MEAKTIGIPEARPPVDIVIPVYGAASEFDRCFKSVLARTNWQHRRLIIVDDCGPDFPPSRDLEKLAADCGAPLLLLHNPRRLGYVSSVNRAIGASPDHDVVLLNSDTEVTPGWVDKLQHSAYSSPKIATVTPFSNNATICSIPRSLEANFIPTGHDPVSFGVTVERVSLRQYPRIPTGVGFCIFIKREALKRVGMFDERRFKLGYGEEADFCMRAYEAGYVHVLDDATFVFHAGQSSFGKGRVKRIRRATRLMRRLHPEYRRLIAEFIREDPLREARERVVAALSPRRARQREAFPRRVLHLIHGWPPFNLAGTEVYARSLAVRQAANREIAAYARIVDPTRESGDVTELFDEGVRVRLTVNNFIARDPTVRNSFRNPRLERDFDRTLAEFQPDLLHVHHLSGHAVTLLDRVAARRIPILYQIQDWWPVCARVQLLDYERRPCDGPGLAKCSVCMPLTGIQPAALWNPLLYAYRGAIMRRALRLPVAYLAGSHFIAESYRRFGLLPENAVIHVLPYGVSHSQLRDSHLPRTIEHPIRFGFIGSIQPHKGLHVAVEAFRGVAPELATLEVWGDAIIDPAYTAELDSRGSSGAVRMHGRFDEAVKDEIFRSIDVLIVPSIGLESFGLVAYEAMCRGVPVLVSRHGALAEIAESGSAWAFEPGNAARLRALLKRLIEQPEEIAQMRTRLPAVKSLEEHTREVEHLYELVARRSRP
ncbi:MAG: glycosyltransferase [Candidatus Binataceae bacterium]